MTTAELKRRLLAAVITPEAEKEQLSPYYAAARLWADAVIDPLETHKVLSEGIAAANHAPIEKAYNVGVIQV